MKAAAAAAAVAAAAVADPAHALGWRLHGRALLLPAIYTAATAGRCRQRERKRKRLMKEVETTTN